MRSLGYASERAEVLIANPLPSLVFGQDSLLVRSHSRYTHQKRPGAYNDPFPHSTPRLIWLRSARQLAFLFGFRFLAK